MLEVSVGLALRHDAPASLGEEALREVHDAGRSELAADLPDVIEALVVMQAQEPIDTAIRLSPADPHLWTFYNIKSRALVGLGQYEEAVYWARKAVRQPSATFWCDLALISALGYLGREDEAQLAIQELYQKKPGYSLEQYALHDFVLTPAAHQVVVEGLRRAGLPEREAGTLDA